MFAKTFWFFVIIGSCQSIACDNLFSTLKKIEPIGSGTAIALATNVVSELMTVYCHELGHALMLKILTGNPIKIEVKPRKKFDLFTPFCGQAFATTPISDKWKGVLVTVAGPIGGIIATHLQLELLNHFDSVKDKNIIQYIKRLCTQSESATASLLQGKLAIQNYPSRMKVAIELLKFMRCTSMVGQTAYGFLPIGLDFKSINGQNFITDGQRLWAALLNCEAPNLGINLLAGSIACMLTPALIGIYR